MKGRNIAPRRKAAVEAARPLVVLWSPPIPTATPSALLWGLQALYGASFVVLTYWVWSCGV